MLMLIEAALAGCIVVTGANIPEGEGFTAADLVTVDGRIAAVGSDLPGLLGDTWKGASCTAVALPEGSVLTPGFVDPWSSIGVSEVGLEDGTVDVSGEGDRIRAGMRVVDAYNPLSAHVPVRRLQGITSSVVVPRGGLVSGQAGWVRLAGSSQSEAVVVPSLAVVAHLDGASRAQALKTLRELLEDARAYRTHTSAVEGNRYRSFVEGAGRTDLEALLPVIAGEQPLVISANRAADIEAVLRLGQEARIRLVLEGAAEGWRHAEALAEAGIPVVIDPFINGPSSFDTIHGRADNAKLLSEAGVPVMFRSTANYNAGALRFVAGNAVRAGLSREAALDGLTRVPALAFGLNDFGTLEVGSVADIVGWSGDPLEFSSRALLVVVDGVRQPLESRHTKLFERYRELPGSPVPALTVK